MRVYFRQDHNYKSGKTHYNCGWNPYAKYDPLTWELPAVEFLKKNFKSVKIKRREESIFNYHVFYFTNKADEAYFMLWSSDGIEI